MTEADAQWLAEITERIRGGEIPTQQELMRLLALTEEQQSLGQVWYRQILELGGQNAALRTHNSQAEGRARRYEDAFRTAFMVEESDKGVRVARDTIRNAYEREHGPGTDPVISPPVRQ